MFQILFQMPPEKHLVCNGKRNSLLHNEYSGTRSENTKTVVSEHALTPSNIDILPTSLVSFEDAPNSIIKSRALLNSDSLIDESYI